MNLNQAMAQLPAIMTNYDKASGFIFVGDPHVSSRSPGRRLENDTDTILVTTDKFDQCIDIANKLNAVVVILGDLFDKSKDSKAWVMTRLFRSLKKAKHPVFCLPGNHDLLAIDVTDDTALAAVAESGLLHLFKHPCGPVASFIFDGVKVGLGGTLHGLDIPDNVLNIFGNNAVDKTVWITHHDIAFDGAYPGSLDTFPIEGCALVVNGHMHRTKPSIKSGDTWWVNPGNIYRQTITDADHIPAAWYWDPKIDLPVAQPLRFIKDVFDWTGKRIVSEAGEVSPDLALMSEMSQFVSQLKATMSAEIPATHDGSVIIDDILAVKEQLKPSKEVEKIIDLLHFIPIDDRADLLS